MAEPKTQLSIQEALLLIANLKGGGCYSLSWPDIRGVLTQLLQQRWWLRHGMNHNWTVYRGRETNNAQFFSNVRDLSYRQAEHIKDYGRCHNPITSTKSIFYCANNVLTVLSEISPDIGEYVHVVEAKQKAAETVWLTMIGGLDYYRRYGHPNPLFDDEKKEVKNAYQDFEKNFKPDSDADLKQIVVDAFLSEVFISPAHRQRDYKITSAMADMIFSNKDHAHDALAYPSVAHRGGMNFAILADRFADKMTITKCEVLEITGYLGFGMYLCRSCGKSNAIANDGEIDWEKLPT